jgi:hypothetical protein
MEIAMSVLDDAKKLAEKQKKREKSYNDLITKQQLETDAQHQRWALIIQREATALYNSLDLVGIKHSELAECWPTVYCPKIGFLISDNVGYPTKRSEQWEIVKRLQREKYVRFRIYTLATTLISSNLRLLFTVDGNAKRNKARLGIVIEKQVAPYSLFARDITISVVERWVYPHEASGAIARVLSDFVK